LVIFSGLAKAETEQLLDYNCIHYGEKSIVGAYGCCYRHGEQALQWIHSGRVVVNDLISHRIPLDELERALELVRKRGGMKILLYPRLGGNCYKGEQG
jgi:L-iditol 2-dehydrogenase